jgi:hypothetical protein
VDELTFQLRDSGARYLLTVGPFLEKALAAARAVGISPSASARARGEERGISARASPRTAGDINSFF